MKLNKTCQLFFGCKIDSKLNDALANAKPGDRRYFEDPESPFLRIVDVPNKDKEERWIGKVVKGGPGVTEVEDIQRNVVSILRRIAPEVRRSPSTVKIFAIDENTEPTKTDDADKQDDNRGSSGPYIANY